METALEVVDDVTVVVVVTFSVIATVTVSLVFTTPDSVTVTVSVVVTFSLTVTVSLFVTFSVTVCVSVIGVHTSMAEEDSKDVHESSVAYTKLSFEDKSSLRVQTSSME